jgi:transposase
MGRPKKLTPEISDCIETLSLLDSTLTNFALMNMVNQKFAPVHLSLSSVSAERVRLGFLWRPPLVKQDLSTAQEHQRLQFASDVLNTVNFDAQKIIFSDESRFVLGDDHRWRHMRVGDWNETAFATKSKFPISVMIWGAIGEDYKSGCIFCSSGVDSEEYQSILQRSELVKDLDALHGRFKWFFMQDGASAHTAKATSKFLSEICLLLPGWPPNSPDLNPIEIVWAIMKQRVKKENPKTKEELIKIIKQVWEELDQEVLNRLVLSFTRRLRLVLDVRGRSISQYISSHQHEPKPEDAAANQDFRLFVSEEDEAILSWVDRIGNRWKRISEILAPQFGQRERTEIKHRSKWLQETRLNLQLMARGAVIPNEEMTPPNEEPADTNETPFDTEAFFSVPAFNEML